jgi:hypothetical protein
MAAGLTLAFSAGVAQAQESTVWLCKPGQSPNPCAVLVVEAEAGAPGRSERSQVGYRRYRGTRLKLSRSTSHAGLR